MVFVSEDKLAAKSNPRELTVPWIPSLKLIKELKEGRFPRQKQRFFSEYAFANIA